MPRVRCRRSEVADPARKKLVLRIAVIECNDETSTHESADVVVGRLPIEGDVRELPVFELDSPFGKVVDIARFRFVLAPVELPIALSDPQLVEVLIAHDHPREWQRVE